MIDWLIDWVHLDPLQFISAVISRFIWSWCPKYDAKNVGWNLNHPSIDTNAGIDKDSVTQNVIAGDWGDNRTVHLIVNWLILIND